MIRAKDSFLLLLACASGVLLNACVSKRKVYDGQLKYSACLQYEPNTKWIGSCDLVDEDEPCPEWGIQVLLEKPIAPCSNEI